jgi:hypothetical protein
VIVGTALVAAIRDGGVEAVARLTKDLRSGLGREGLSSTGISTASAVDAKEEA